MTTILVASILMNLNAPASPRQLNVGNGLVSLSIDRSTGVFDISWPDASIRRAYGEVRLPSGDIQKTSDYARHEMEQRPVDDVLGKGRMVIVRHTGDGKPELRHTFWLYDKRPEALVRLDLIGAEGSNRISPVITRSVKLPAKGRLESLFVPYDNDDYVRYHSQWWGEGDGNGDGSYEVGALYDDQSRRGIVIGSIDHDLWKSAVLFDRSGGMRAVAGVASKYTRDTVEHGIVRGSVVRSPRFVLGLYPDWRKGLERYGDLNALVQPPLKWTGTVPFGWNSWSGHKTKVSREAMDAALDFIDRDLPWLRTGNTAYVNFDSFWDNLTREQRVDFVKKTKARGLKAGIYWTPFVNWGEPDWNTVDGYKFRDLQLKNEKGELLPKLDSGWPLDPTHPGTLMRIDENIRDFIDQGFEYIKLDFMTHGALEGVHFNPRVTTGTAAYRIGMQRVIDELAKAPNPIFVSLSIAPMFPHGYGHSRRISCDIFSNIGASEYFLNSLNYGWWTGGRLYQYNDPDSACVYQALGEDSTTEAEAQTRFTASVIGGGMMIEGDDLTNPAARERVLRIFSNREALALAQRTPQFLPVRGDTESKAGDAFVFHDGKGSAYLALFNFSKTERKAHRVPIDRLGLQKGKWSSRDLWKGQQKAHSGAIEIDLDPTECALLHLTRG